MGAGGGKTGAQIGTLLAQTLDYKVHRAGILPQPHDLGAPGQMT